MRYPHGEFTVGVVIAGELTNADSDEPSPQKSVSLRETVPLAPTERLSDSEGLLSELNATPQRASGVKPNPDAV